MGTIYKITNTLNGKRYVGQTQRCPVTHWRNYRYAANHHAKYQKKGRPILDALVSIGIENFAFEIIEECLDDQLNERERHWIRELNTNIRTNGHGYNLTEGGQDRYTRKQQRPHLHTPEAKEKIRQAHKGRIRTEEHNKNISLARTGQPGRQQSDAERAQRKQTLKPYMHPVIQCDLEGKEIVLFTSIKQAILWLNANGWPKANAGHIRGCVTGKRNRIYGYKWKNCQ